jgi:hypothetical protein
VACLLSEVTPREQPRACIQNKKCGEESALFNRIHILSFLGLGADTPTFLRVDSLSLGVGGVLSVFSRNGKTSVVHYRTLSFFAFRFLPFVFQKNESSLFFVILSTKSLSNLFASLRYW